MTREIPVTLMSSATPADRSWLRAAIDLSRSCPPVPTAYSVGAIIVGPDGRELARGYSRELQPGDHAEEVALARVETGVDLAGTTLYTSLEPCRSRRSRPRSCTELIRAAGIGRVVFAWREPPLFAAGGGGELLRAAGLDVVEVPDLAVAARQVNAHLLPRRSVHSSGSG